MTRSSSRKDTAPRRADTLRGRVKAHDPFELIRWLAMSQPDPRKALAELVQNSLDASARSVVVTRLRERGLPCLKIRDDGEGVLADLPRPEALRYIATHIGHSRKRSLSPQERLTLMTQGQYGIGLLGFWAMGEVLEIRSFVPGQAPYRLVLYRDKPDYLVEPVRGRLTLDERATEVHVAGLHRDALSALVGNRAADFLAAELRGQLLSRDVELIVEDRIARRKALKHIVVKPPRFLGERLEGIGPVSVPGYPDVRFEVYLAGDGAEAQNDAAGLAVYGAGTLVAPSFGELAALGLARSPWTDTRFRGLVDFPGLRVAPGSRRGVVVDDAASAFARALEVVEPILNSVLEAHEKRQAEELDQGVIRDLQRAFKDFYRERPRYAMLPVEDPGDAGAGPTGGGAADADAGGGAPVDPDSEPDSEPAGAEDSPAASDYLLPPGPLDRVRIVPATIRLDCATTKTVRCEGVDGSGRSVERPTRLAWRVTGEAAAIALPETGAHSDRLDDLVEQAVGRLTLHAAHHPATGTLLVEAQETGGGPTVAAEAPIHVALPNPGESDEGIPEPELVDLPGEPWRSRMLEDRWQVNAGHREYRAIAHRARLKLRYLAMLFAKEVVQRSHQDPRLGAPLEQLVEIAAFADRNVDGKRGGRRRRPKPAAASSD